MILNIFNFIAQGLIYFIFINITNKNKIKNNKSIKLLLFICCLLCSLPQFISKSLFPLNMVITLGVYFFALFCILKIEIKFSIIQTVLFSIFTFVCESLSVLIMLTFSIYSSGDELVNNSIASNILLIIFYIISLIVLLIINMIISRKNYNNYFIKFFVSKQFFSFLLLIILTVIPQLVLIVYNRYEYNLPFLLFNIIQTIIISIYMLYSVYTYLEKEKFKEENKQLEIDNKAMVSLIDGVRAVKHDFNNIFQAIHGYICIKDYDKLETYVASVMQECNILNNITFLNKELFDDPGIYGVVGSKQFYANSIGILFEIDITHKISNINFPKDQLCRIFGIILDNAIEATNKVEDKNVKLEIHFNKLKNATVIKVYNTFKEDSNIELSRIYEKGYSSKKVKSGIGLWEVKKFIDNHKKSQIYATVENKMFVQNIIIEN